MTISSLIKKLPDYANDIKRNLDHIFIQDKHSLSKLQLYGISLSVAYLLKNEQLLNNVRVEAKMFLEEVDATACKVAAIMMSMNNTYYHFIYDINDQAIEKHESGLSMETILNPSVSKTELEMYCLAVSILHGCKYCCSVHTNKLKNRGIEQTVIEDIAKIVAILKATRDTMDIERMRSYDFIVREESIY